MPQGDGRTHPHWPHESPTDDVHEALDHHHCETHVRTAQTGVGQRRWLSPGVGREKAVKADIALNALSSIPKRARASGKVHWTAVTPEMLAREFARLRDKTGICTALKTGQRTTFHEIRALGGKLYRRAGWTNEAIQRLLGHSTENMTPSTT